MNFILSLFTLYFLSLSTMCLYTAIRDFRPLCTVYQTSPVILGVPAVHLVSTV